ncbi:MAG: CoA transferase [Alphaproteobacteria bacterium]
MTANGSYHDGLTPTGPLAGVKVVDVTINVLGPAATQILGDMGAEAIKVEFPAGDPMRRLGSATRHGMAPHFLGFNRNKRSVVLDLKHPPAREALMRLIETADVFVHTMRLHAARRLGIDYPALRERNSRLIYASATGYRKGGANRDRPAFDDVIQGESGMAAMIGRANGEPRYVPMALADKFCGHVLASAIGMALFHRERSGRSQEVHVPMFESMVSFNLADQLWEGAFDAPERGLGYPRMFSPGRRPHAASDGYICLLAVTDEQWRRLFAAIGRPESIEDDRFFTMAARTEHIDALYTLLAEALESRTVAEWRERLDAADVPNGPLNDLADLFDDPYLRQTGFFHTYRHPEIGKIVATGIPVDFSGSPGNLRLPPPMLGQHTSDVLSAVGYSNQEIAAINGAAKTP